MGKGYPIFGQSHVNKNPRDPGVNSQRLSAAHGD